MTLTQPALGPYSGTFTLTASGGPVTFSVIVPGDESYLTVSPASGTLAAGHTATITVSLTGSSPAYYNTLTVDPGGIAVTVLYPPAG